MAYDDVRNPGPFPFERSKEQKLCNTANNVNQLRLLWLDRSWINEDAIGPGDPGDFEQGAWHIACHLLAAGGVLQASDGRLLWLEVSHDHNRDRYFSSVTWDDGGVTHVFPLDSAEGRELISESSLLGFVEGNSTGRTSARGATDSPSVFNLWRRQDFDQPVASEVGGGKVWEHWCTLRDIRATSELATSVLTAYISLVAALGDRFVATVARGRSDYGHPKQLCAMIEAGLVSEEAATLDIMPVPILAQAERDFAAAEPRRALRASAMLDWSGPPKYHMFRRRIQDWLNATNVRIELEHFRKS